MLTFVLVAVVLTTAGEVHAARWSLGGGAALAWAGGWPSLDLRVRWSHHISEGHALGLTAGLSSERLATRGLYLTEYSHTWIRGWVWPVVSLWMGGVTDMAGVLAQSQIVVGLAFGARFRVGSRMAIRLELAHELIGGSRRSDRTALTVSFEYLGGSWGERPSSTSR
jgi:hypothetical protein